METPDPSGFPELGGAAREGELGRLAAPSANLHLAPPPAHREAGTERLQRGFLRGEARGQVLGGIVPAEGIGDLRLREDALEEPVEFAV